jgi:hypothetical protein
MKKMTLFLLTFLLLIGFINVNAQKPGNGVTPRTAFQLAVSSGSDLLCANSDVTVSFLVGDDIDRPDLPLTNPTVYVSYDYDPITGDGNWDAFPPTVASPDNISFFYTAVNMSQTMSFYATVEQGEALDPDYVFLTSPVLTVPFISQPVITLTSDFSQTICAGGESGIELTAMVEWGDYGLTINYAWSSNLGFDPDPENPLTGVYSPLGSETSYTFYNMEAGTHNLRFGITVPRTIGCNISESLPFTIYPEQQVTLSAGDYASVCEDVDNIVLTASFTSNLPPNNNYCVNFTLYDENDVALFNSGPQCGMSVVQLPSWLGGGIYQFSLSRSYTIPGSSLNLGTNVFRVEVEITHPSGLINCIAVDEVEVVVNPLPVVTLDEEEYRVCLGEELKITATRTNTTAPYSFQWSSDNIDGSVQFQIVNPNNPPLQSIFNVNTSVADTGFIVVTVKDGNGCIGVDSAEVMIHALPVVSFDIYGMPEVNEPFPGAPANQYPWVCISTPQFLLQGGDPSHLIRGKYEGPGVTAKTMVGQFFNPANAGVGIHELLYIYTDENGCTDTARAELRVMPLPTATLVYPDSVCPNWEYIEPILTAGTQITQARLDATKVFSIEPEEGLIIDANSGVLDLTDATPGTYVITVTFDGIYCSNFTTDTIVVLPLPTFTFSEESYSACVGAYDEIVVAAIPEGTEPFTYEWWSIATEGTLSGIPVDSTYRVYTNALGKGYVYVMVEDAYGCISLVDSVPVEIVQGPELLASITNAPNACAGQNTILTATLLEDAPSGVVVTWFDVTNSNAPLGSGFTMSVPGATAAANTYAATATTLEGCTHTLEYTLQPITNPVTNVVINNIPDLCNYTLINLNIVVNSLPNTTQTYTWFMRQNTGTAIAPVWSAYAPITLTNNQYFVGVNDAVVTLIQFQVLVNTDGYLCPVLAESNVINITPAIKVDIMGNEIDTVCHGGSVELRFALSNIQPGIPVWYRILENNVWYEGVNEVHMVEPGQTEIWFTTLPSLHENEHGPESYCYAVEVWQYPTRPYFHLDSPYPDVCYTTSACHWVTVLPDAEIILHGPTYVQKDGNPPVFTANAIGGYGETTYEWYLNGFPVQTGTENTYTMDDPDVLGTIGNHNIAVKATQNVSGCAPKMVNRDFFVVNGCGEVSIVGPTTGCAGELIILTAIVVAPEYIDYTLQWKQGGQILIGETGHTLSFIAPDNVDLLDFTVEVTCGGCDKDVAPVHYFQVIPTTVLLVDNYVICEQGAVTVTADAIVFGEGQIYRYIWYKNNQGESQAFDTTYVNHRLFTYNEIVFDGDVATFWVSAQMLNAVCSSNLAEFTITQQGTLDEVVLTATPTVICSGSLVYFEIGEDSNIPNYGVPTITWWINGFEVPGESLTYLNMPFYTPGTHYAEVRLVYPDNACEYVTDAVQIEVLPIPSVVIAGPVLVCNTENTVVLQSIVDPLLTAVSYQWYLDGDSIIGGTEPNQAVITIPKVTPYIYVVEITDLEGGCIVLSAPHTLYVNEYPVIGITASKTEICSAETVMLTANVSDVPNMTYQWYAGGIPILGANAPIYYVNPTVTTVYSFTATELETECVATSNEVTVTVIPAPTNIFNTPVVETICQGDQSTFIANFIAGVIYTWYINGTEVPGATTNEFTYTFEQYGEFVVKVSATSIEAGCTSELELAGVITVKAAVNVEISGVTTVCGNAAGATLYAITTPPNASVEYQWFLFGNPIPGATGASFDISDLAVSPYPYAFTVLVTDIHSECERMSPVHEVNVVQFLSIGAEADLTEVCAGTVVKLTANVNEDPNMEYQWFANGLPIPGETYPICYVAPNQTTTYHFEATQIGSACNARSNDITVVVNPAPSAPVLTISETMICNGDQVTLAGNIDGIYAWFRNGGTTSFVEKIITDQPAATDVLTYYTYTASVTVDGCTSVISDPVTVVVHPTINATISGAHEVCDQALGDEQLVLHAIVTGKQPGVIYEFNWTLVRGENPEEPVVEYYNYPYCVVENNLPVNDPASPYYYRVYVRAIGYECTTMSPAHEVNVLPKPSVNITVDNESICLGGTIVATAWATPAPTPENPYDYIWTVNGVPYGQNSNQIFITNDLIIGVNEIAVTIQRSYGSLSCFGTTTKLVNVLTNPELILTQNTTGICVGGQVELNTVVVNFDENLVNSSDFTYEWRLNNNPIPSWIYPEATDVLNTPGTYTYQVKANSILGCNTEWHTFEPIRVVAQPTVQIAPKDFHSYEVCEGASIEIINILGIVDPYIQMGFEYKWNDETTWTSFTNQIPPRWVEFPQSGTYSYYLEVRFANSTCQPAVSNTLTYKVERKPEWSHIAVKPNPLQNVLCLGETVYLEAEFSSTLGNIGTPQWYYSFNGGIPIPIMLGGYQEFTPSEAGQYTFILTFNLTNVLSGCAIADWTSEPLTVNGAPTAVFNENESITSICANTAGQPARLVIDFTGTPPFRFSIQGTPGTLIRYTSLTHRYVLEVTPLVTTQYTLESLSDESKCTTAVFEKSDITVTVTDVVLLTNYVEACDATVDVYFTVHTLSSRLATITFPGSAPRQSYITSEGVLTIDIPKGTPIGTYVVSIMIDNCEFFVTVVNNYGDGIVNSLVLRRWEGYAEVLVVNNNPETNGGYVFTSYQWYKNGTMIPGATQQWYQDMSGVNGIYSVRLTGTKDGVAVDFKTCDMAFNPTSSIKVYPVPAHVDEPVTVELDLSVAELEGAVLDIYDARGAHVQHIKVTSSITKITGFKAQGTYFGRITTGTNEIKAIKFVIVK